MNIEQLRTDTPGVEHVIHLNNAGAALMPNQVVNVMTGHLQLETRLGGYEAAGQSAVELDNVYNSIGRLINASPAKSR